MKTQNQFGMALDPADQDRLTKPDADIRNDDEDLHAFVPLLLLQHTNVQVSGNGAPEFNETGFVMTAPVPEPCLSDPTDTACRRAPLRSE